MSNLKAVIEAIDLALQEAETALRASNLYNTGEMVSNYELR